MKTPDRVPEGIRVTMETFERVIDADEARRCELVAEIAQLAKRHDALAEDQDPAWILESFVEPRLKELRTVVSRLNLIRGRLEKLRREWMGQASPLTCYEPFQEESPILCVTA